jgi:hypothetical protein
VLGLLTSITTATTEQPEAKIEPIDAIEIVNEGDDNNG